MDTACSVQAIWIVQLIGALITGGHDIVAVAFGSSVSTSLTQMARSYAARFSGTHLAPPPLVPTQALGAPISVMVCPASTLPSLEVTFPPTASVIVAAGVLAQ